MKMPLGDENCKLLVTSAIVVQLSWFVKVSPIGTEIVSVFACCLFCLLTKVNLEERVHGWHQTHSASSAKQNTGDLTWCPLVAPRVFLLLYLTTRCNQIRGKLFLIHNVWLGKKLRFLGSYPPTLHMVGKCKLEAAEDMGTMELVEFSSAKPTISFSLFSTTWLVVCLWSKAHWCIISKWNEQEVI